MSVFATAPMVNGWQQQQHHHLPSMLGGPSDDLGLGIGIGRIQTSTLERPTIRSHRSFPNTLTSTYTKHEVSSLNMSTQNQPGSHSVAEHEQNTQPQPQTEQTYGGSAPASPAPQISPTLGDDIQGDSNDDDNFSDYEGPGSEEGDRSGQPERTAEQRRNDKRKMKRFRLTHNQTRFLMGEFARQAHPDAAQRERLSKEIPGLSPRQVQVWFQNRRAKLKRLTADDREKIMKSRALPEDFDMAHTLHSPFHANVHPTYAPQYPSAHLSATTMYNPPHFGDSGLNRPPLIMHNLRRESEDESALSPISISSNYNNYYTPPTSNTTGSHMSPISPVMDRAPYSSLQYQQNRARLGQYTPRSASFPSGAPPRLNIGLDRLSTSRPEGVGSPLRSSMSYGQNYEFPSHSAEETVSTPSNSSILSARTFGTDSTTITRPGSFSYLNAQAPLPATSSLIRPRSNLPPNLDARSSPYNRSLYPFPHLQQIQGESQQDNSNTGIMQNQPLTLAQLQNQPTNQQHHSPTAGSMNYQSPSMTTDQDYHLPNPVDLYGQTYSQNTEQDISGYGLSQQAMPIEPNVEPESYYKAEHGIAGRRTSISTHTPQHELPQPLYPTNVQAMPSQTTQILQQQQTQHFGGTPPTPRSAGLKRRRDEGEDDEEEARGGEIGQDMGASRRRRSFTTSGGYRPFGGVSRPP